MSHLKTAYDYGLQQALQTFIKTARVGLDDFVHPDAIEQIVRALRGAGVGGAAGAGVGAGAGALTAPEDERLQAALMGALMGAPVGAVAGGAMPFMTHSPYAMRGSGLLRRSDQFPSPILDALDPGGYNEYVWGRNPNALRNALATGAAGTAGAAGAGALGGLAQGIGQE